MAHFKTEKLESVNEIQKGGGMRFVSTKHLWQYIFSEDF